MTQPSEFKKSPKLVARSPNGAKNASRKNPLSRLELFQPSVKNDIQYKALAGFPPNSENYCLFPGLGCGATYIEIIQNKSVAVGPVLMAKIFSSSPLNLTLIKDIKNYFIGNSTEQLPRKTYGNFLIQALENTTVLCLQPATRLVSYKYANATIAFQVNNICNATAQSFEKALVVYMDKFHTITPPDPGSSTGTWSSSSTGTWSSSSSTGTWPSSSSTGTWPIILKHRHMAIIKHGCHSNYK